MLVPNRSSVLVFEEGLRQAIQVAVRRESDESAIRTVTRKWARPGPPADCPRLGTEDLRGVPG